MQISSAFKFGSALVLAASAGVYASAQAAPSSGPMSTVVYASGDDLVLKASDGKLLNYTTPAGFKVSVGDKMMMVSELKPGAKITKPVSTGTDPKIISSVAVVKGKVYAVTPPDAVTLSLAEGTKDLSVPAGTKFMVDGKSMGIGELKAGMMVEATIVTTAADGAPVAAAPATPPMMGSLLVAKTLADGEADLPLAGTNLPLIGMMGGGLLLFGFALMTFRKPSEQM